MAQEEDIKYFVRISNSDLDGTKQVKVALTGIKGVGRHTAGVITRLASVNGHDIMGRLKDEDVDRSKSCGGELYGESPGVDGQPAQGCVYWRKQAHFWHRSDDRPRRGHQSDEENPLLPWDQA